MHRNRSIWLVAALVLAGLWAWTQPSGDGTLQPSVPGVTDTPTGPVERPATTGYPSFLPAEAHPVLDAIAAGGPYGYRQDGGVFQNREGLLPRQPRGYYREFTVETPGSRDRGARRIISGGEPPVEYFYTDDHYRSFRRFTSAGAGR